MFELFVLFKFSSIEGEQFPFNIESFLLFKYNTMK
jgi:hypothetical protein